MCTRDLHGFKNPEGGKPIFGWAGEKAGLQKQPLPCGKCPECVKSYYTDWATRGYFELLQWSSNLFITLTYSNEHLPEKGSLKKSDIQKFIKRVKKHFRSTKENPIRQIYCGEYGEHTKRPHYHAILFNCYFDDQVRYRTSDQGHSIFTSKKLTTLWGKGNVEFGYAEASSIAYLFKYILKKKTRKERRRPLSIYRDGVEYLVEHEFIETSRNPGIGACLRTSDSIKKGYLYVDGVKKKLPKYILEHLKKESPEIYNRLSEARADHFLTLPIESGLRREQKEFAQKKLTNTKRKL